jgi:hypothetical protein
MSRIPEYGAQGYHWRGRWGFVNLYCWRRGPWRLHWSLHWRWAGRWQSWHGAAETSMRQSLLRRALTDVLWGLRRRVSA